MGNEEKKYLPSMGKSIIQKKNTSKHAINFSTIKTSRNRLTKRSLSGMRLRLLRQKRIPRLFAKG